MTALEEEEEEEQPCNSERGVQSLLKFISTSWSIHTDTCRVGGGCRPQVGLIALTGDGAPYQF